jgi:hypothetical protein
VPPVLHTSTRLFESAAEHRRQSTNDEDHATAAGLEPWPGCCPWIHLLRTCASARRVMVVGPGTSPCLWPRRAATAAHDLVCVGEDRPLRRRRVPPRPRVLPKPSPRLNGAARVHVPRSRCPARALPRSRPAACRQGKDVPLLCSHDRRVRVAIFAGRSRHRPRHSVRSFTFVSHSCPVLHR